MTRISAPQPTVIHLVTLFRKISAGEIRIPTFQRKFVWREKQILNLLESVFDGYPIGSLLFWNVDNNVFETAPKEVTAFPDLPEQFPLDYVLDGMQRLTTLYGVFHYEIESGNSQLNAHYDLVEKRFFIPNEGQKIGEGQLPLSSLFSPKKLLEFQGALQASDLGENLIEDVLELQSAFQEYMVPVVTIRTSDVQHVVGIFERINSTGTRLNAVDFMRAITWSNTFDLSENIAQVDLELATIGIELAPDTIVKCVALNAGLDITSEALLDLRQVEEDVLTASFTSVFDTLKLVFDYLRDEFKIFSSDMVAYEGQLLVAFVSWKYGLNPELRDLLNRWFWACGANEYLRGKPDDFIAREVKIWQETLEDGAVRSEPRLLLTEKALLDRRLLAGAALTNTYKMLYASIGARSMFDGAEIPAEEYMSSNSTSLFVPVYDKPVLSGIGYSNISSVKYFANCILVERSRSTEALANGGEFLIGNAIEELDTETLETQFICDLCIEHFRNGDAAEFLRQRARNMVGILVAHVGETDTGLLE